MSQINDSDFKLKCMKSYLEFTSMGYYVRDYTGGYSIVDMDTNNEYPAEVKEIEGFYTIDAHIDELTFHAILKDKKCMMAIQRDNGNKKQNVKAINKESISYSFWEYYIETVDSIAGYKCRLKFFTGLKGIRLEFTLKSSSGISTYRLEFTNKNKTNDGTICLLYSVKVCNSDESKESTICLHVNKDGKACHYEQNINSTPKISVNVPFVDELDVVATILHSESVNNLLASVQKIIEKQFSSVSDVMKRRIERRLLYLPDKVYISVAKAMSAIGIYDTDEVLNDVLKPMQR